MPSVIVFQNKITISKLSMKSSRAKIFRKNVYNEAKLVPIFTTNFSREKNSFPTLLAYWRRVCSGEKSKVISVMFKIRIERIKAEKVIELKLYNVKFNIWIRALGKSG